ANGGAYTNEVWALNLDGTADWEQLMPSGPQPTGSIHPLVAYDPVRDRMIVYGGLSATTVPLGDVWALGLSGPLQWTQLWPIGTSPPPRWGAVGGYDTNGDPFIRAGGSTTNRTSVTNDPWSLS